MLLQYLSCSDGSHVLCTHLIERAQMTQCESKHSRFVHTLLSALGPFCYLCPTSKEGQVNDCDAGH